MLGFLESIFLEAKQAFAKQDLAKKILLILLMRTKPHCTVRREFKCNCTSLNKLMPEIPTFLETSTRHSEFLSSYLWSHDKILENLPL